MTQQQYIAETFAKLMAAKIGHSGATAANYKQEIDNLSELACQMADKLERIAAAPWMIENGGES